MCKPPARRVDLDLTLREADILAGAMEMRQETLPMLMFTKGPMAVMTFQRAQQILSDLHDRLVAEMDFGDSGDAYLEQISQARADGSADEHYITLEDLCPGDLASLGNIATDLAMGLKSGNVIDSKTQLGHEEVERLVLRIMAATMYAADPLYGAGSENLPDRDQAIKILRVGEERHPDANGDRMRDHETGEPIRFDPDNVTPLASTDPHFLSGGDPLVTEGEDIQDEQGRWS